MDRVIRQWPGTEADLLFSWRSWLGLEAMLQLKKSCDSPTVLRAALQREGSVELQDCSKLGRVRFRVLAYSSSMSIEGRLRTAVCPVKAIQLRMSGSYPSMFSVNRFLWHTCNNTPVIESVGK